MTSLDIDEISREIAWWLRNTTPWSPPVIRRRRSWPMLLRSLPPVARSTAKALASRYHLDNCEKTCDAQGFQESLYILDVLDRYVGAPVSPWPSLDIGCKNGCYLPGLQAWSGGAWDGVELDAHRRYWNLTTRRAHGQAIAHLLPGCRYIAGDLMDISGIYGFISWFLPFLHDTPLKAWGLPHRFLKPLILLRQAWALLAPGGRLFIVNQGEVEAELQARLFQETGITAQAIGRIESPLSPFQLPRYGFLVERLNEPTF